MARNGDDPFGDTPTWALTKSQLDKHLEGDDAVAAGLVHSAVEEFAGELATVARRFLALDEWKDTEHIVVGGGLSGSHIGKIAIGRALVLLKEKGVEVGLSAITNHPDEAGLLGGLELAPSLDPGRARRHHRGRHRRHQPARGHCRAQDQEGGHHQGGHLEILAVAPPGGRSDP